MKTILFDLPVAAEDSPFLDRPEHTGQEPYIYLRNRLREMGYESHTPHGRSLRECARVLMWDVRDDRLPRSWRLSRTRRLAHTVRTAIRRVVGRAVQRTFYEDCLEAGLGDRMALVLSEPPVVHPPNWDTRVHAHFPAVLTWNDRWVNDGRYHQFRLPLRGDFPEVADPPFSRRKLLVNFSGNKFSTHPQELYSARRETIRYFEKHHPDQFDLFGPGWDTPGYGETPYTSWRGWVDHKWQVYPNYRFGLCYENMRDEPGYVTEKIFDCMRAGCVPIYWGAPDVEKDVDPATFIDRTQFESDADLATALRQMSEQQWTRYRDAARAYLAGPQFAAFLPPAYADSIIRGLGL
jgi:hypothetical protein